MSDQTESLSTSLASEQTGILPAQQPGEPLSEWVGRLTPEERQLLGTHLAVARMHDLRNEEERLRAKAAEIHALLRRHVPADRWSEVADLMSNKHGCVLLAEAIAGERKQDGWFPFCKCGGWFPF